MAKKKKKQGAMRQLEQGKKLIMLGVAPGTWERLKEAAALELRPLTQFVVYYALVAAQQVIKDHVKKDIVQQLLMDDRREL